MWTKRVGMRKRVELTGSSWGHTRGHDPLVAAAAQYSLERPVDITWTPRTLTEFGVLDVADLADRFDLVVVDHPHVGGVADTGSLVPLDTILDRSSLERVGLRSPGRSHQSYHFAGHQWALAIDAACQVAAWRASLPRAEVPSTWRGVAELARRGGVIWPINPVDIQASFMTIAAAMGTPIDGSQEQFVPLGIGLAVLEAMHSVTKHIDPECFNLNAIDALESMSTGAGAAAYCPLVFGYTNYSRAGFRERLVQFGDIVGFGDGLAVPRGALLGGVGLGVSAASLHTQDAADFALWVAGADVQRGVFFTSGGQPANVAAWEDEVIDRAAGGFFTGTRETIENSWMRPRMPGYVQWQNESSAVLHETLQRGTGFEAAIAELNRIAPDARERATE